MKRSAHVKVRSLDLSPEGLKQLSAQFDLETQETRAEQFYKAMIRERGLRMPAD